MTVSVRTRITALATAIVAVTLTIVSLLVIQLVERDVRAAGLDAVRTALSEQAATGEPRGFALTVGTTQLEFGTFEQQGELVFGEVRRDGRLVAEVELNTTTGLVNELRDPETHLTLADPELRAALEELTYVLVDADLGPGRAVLVGAAAPDELDVSTDAVRRALLLTVPLIVLAFAALTWLLVGRALRPVAAITRRAEAVGASSLGERVPVPPTGDEIAQLAIVVNGMLDRIESGTEQQRHFAADASHELRSPLSTIRAAAELIEADPAADRSGRLAGTIVSEADRIDALVGDLLELARLDADVSGQGRAAWDDVDLTALVGRVADHAVELDVADIGDVTVVGSAGQLERMVTNLLDNARRHADSHVRLSLRVIDDQIVLTVDDDGPGIALADRDRVFERFTRLDDARDRQAGGVGLGLAIVGSIVDAHGGTIVVGDSDLGGARFEVRLEPGTVG